jgi:hypothetical protein
MGGLAMSLINELHLDPTWVGNVSYVYVGSIMILPMYGWFGTYLLCLLKSWESKVLDVYLLSSKL